MTGSHRLCQLGSGRALLARTLGAFLPGMEIEELHMNSCQWGLLRASASSSLWPPLPVTPGEARNGPEQLGKHLLSLNLCYSLLTPSRLAGTLSKARHCRMWRQTTLLPSNSRAQTPSDGFVHCWLATFALLATQKLLCACLFRAPKRRSTYKCG